MKTFLFTKDALTYEEYFLFSIQTNVTSFQITLLEFSMSTYNVDLLIATLSNSYAEINESHCSF